MELDKSAHPFKDLAKTSQMARNTIAFDWSKTELGPIETWDSGLINSLRIVFSCPIGMYCTWGPQRRVFYNDAYISILKHRHPTALGKPVHEVWGEVWEQVHEIIKKVETGGSVLASDVQFDIEVNGNPQGHYYTYGNSPLFNSKGEVSGMLCTIMDTTLSVVRTHATEITLAKTIQEVRSEKRKLRTILEKTPIAMAVLEGPELRYTMVNDYYRKLFIGNTDVTGRSIKDIFPKLNRVGIIEKLDDVYNHGKIFEAKNFETKDNRADGVPFSIFIDFVFQPIYDANDRIEGLIIAINDVTARVIAERDLQSAKIAAENANHAKSAFLANMSHEIRTPLGIILGFSEIICTQDMDTEEKEKYLDIILRNGTSLTRIIDDILDLSKIEAGKIEIQETPVKLKSIAQEVLAMFYDPAKRKNIQLDYSLNDIDNLIVMTDAVRIRQVLVNLIGNAVKFTSEGSVKLSCRTEQISNTCKKIIFEIQDSGIGMTQEQADRLFTPFTQADATSTRKFGGTGLGLALSRNLAHALSGDVRILGCKPHEGCLFEFTFEAEDVNRVFGSAQGDALKPDSQRVFAGINVLAVDDSQDNRALIKMILNNAGIQVTDVESGEAALKEAQAHSYDLVLMDIQMPGLDGFGTLSELRKNGFQGPIVALTAHAMKEDKDRTLTAGFSDHLTKPINSKALLQTIQSHIKHP